jgi:cytochrome c-type biogenesis protein CcmH/NrfG
MANGAKASSHSNATWTSGQAYALALICLGVGLVLGYLFRGSASPAPATSAAVTQQGGTGQMPGPAAIPGSMPGESQIPAEMVQAKAQPWLDALQKNPNDLDALTNLGNLYYDVKQFPQAVDYYAKVLAQQPSNVGVRTDMGTAYWYMGDADRALSEFQKSLSYSPNHPQTLFNMGIVMWQGKKDPKGAVAAWEKLLQNNPDYPQRDTVQTFIAQAKQHASK